MKAVSVVRDRTKIDDRAFTEVVIWQVPRPVPGCSHHFKYRLAFIVDDVCVVRFDNEAGKGDHKHIGDLEEPYVFTNTETLLADFRAAVLGWRR
jgi:hypothetical protein